MRYDRLFLLVYFTFILTAGAYAASPYSFNIHEGGLLEPVDVIVGDQTSPPILVYMNRVEASAILTANFTINSYDVTINDTGNVNVGDYVGVFNQENNVFYVGNILSVLGNVVTMDTPSDFNFTVGDIFQCGSKDMNVDGSVTPQIFSLRADPNLDITVDITRVIIHITDNTAMDDEKFGGINALTRGVVLRRVDGNNQNLFNVKTNGEFGELAFDKSYDDKAPAGFFGYSSRLTFAGANKIGVAIRLGPNDDLQLIVQDDLTALNTFRIMVEGHVVVP